MINAAKYFGYVFKGRDEDNNLIVDIQNENLFETKYKLLNIIEFTSARKRMSVIIRDDDGKIFIMCKGADNILIPKLKKGSPYLQKT